MFVCWFCFLSPTAMIPITVELNWHVSPLFRHLQDFDAFPFSRITLLTQNAINLHPTQKLFFFCLTSHFPHLGLWPLITLCINCTLNFSFSCSSWSSSFSCVGRRRRRWAQNWVFCCVFWVCYWGVLWVGLLWRRTVWEWLLPHR